MLVVGIREAEFNFALDLTHINFLSACLSACLSLNQSILFYLSINHIPLSLFTLICICISIHMFIHVNLYTVYLTYIMLYTQISKALQWKIF